MRKFLPLFILFLGLDAFSQRETGSEKKDTILESVFFQIDTIQKIDNEYYLQDANAVDFVNKTSAETFIKDSIIFKLLDHPKAALIDSLWQKELFASSLYQDYKDKLIHQEYNEEAFAKLPTDTLKKRLKAIDAKTPFKIEYNPLLERYIKSYLGRNKKAIEELMALSAYYFPMFEQKLDKYNIPLEIKYLAIVESSLNPRARSHAGATGLWQFMYATAKMHGLDVSSYVDERMDPMMATEAAAKYLSTLYRVFENWDLVLASYNSGPGNVSKAIRRSGGSLNYWELRPFLPRETANYVPAFIGIMYVFEYAEEHGFQPPTPVTTYFETDTVKIKRNLSFEEISNITGVEKDLLKFLNPSYKLNYIPFVSDEDYVLRLPREKIGIFVTNEEEIYRYVKVKRKQEKNSLAQAKESSRIEYRVKSGDYLGKIAEKFGIRVSKLKRWNNLRSNTLRIGQVLVVYPEKSYSSKSGVPPNIYTVKAGDSLWSISKKFRGLTVQKIKAYNDMENNVLRPGMTLRLN